jgi:hypothetical protein
LAFATVSHGTGETVELRIAGQRIGSQVQQPRRNHAATTPDLSDISHVQIKSLIFRQAFAGFGLEDVEALGERGHHAVLDAVVDHLHEVPGACGTGVDVAVLGTVVIGFAVLGTRDVAHARRQCGEQRIQTFDRLGVAANHHAIAAFQAPDAAGGADVDVVQALLVQRLGATNVVLVVGVAAVDDRIAGLKQFAQGVDGVFGRCARRQHDPDRARLVEAGDQCRQVGDASGALGDQVIDESGIAVVNNGGVPVEHQTSRNIAAHAAQSNNPELHVLMLLTTNKCVSLVIAQRD